MGEDFSLEHLPVIVSLYAGPDFDPVSEAKYLSLRLEEKNGLTS